MIWQHAGQLQHLEITNEEVKNDDRELLLVDIFGETSPGCMPLLETLTIRSFVGKPVFSGHQILDLLRQMPNIIKFRTEPSYHLLLSEEIIVPSLRQLLFGDDKDWHDEILDFLSLPALETLAVSMDFPDNALRFMMRSTPPLQDLEIAWNCESSSIHLLECLRLTPSLVQLRMLWPEVPLVEDFFAALANSPSLLPNLCRLIVHPEYDSDIFEADSPSMFPSVFSEVFWRTLVRALSARHNQLRVFTLEPVKMPLASDVLAVLNELVVGGMQIYVGTEESNFAATGFPMEALRYYDRWWE
ncbi:F-box domain-containing protein [Mycena sanguinolenta]|uniref:F-box domain-containing protein n=1 Tax=Mycena sanguinolenta TaxID=230812 RepID=A0A8H6XRB2_9AGAR|nr:F-box domain-containing protein [Mycena sanguinolenta]